MTRLSQSSHPVGHTTVRRYHTHSQKSVFPIPERTLSRQNGTVIFPFGKVSAASPRALPLQAGSSSNNHSPLRLHHASRRICGRGYSGRGIVCTITDSLLFVFFRFYLYLLYLSVKRRRLIRNRIGRIVRQRRICRIVDSVVCTFLSFRERKNRFSVLKHQICVERLP